jgi:ribosomal protein S18 acetylase RimI-like enzyme
MPGHLPFCAPDYILQQRSSGRAEIALRAATRADAETLGRQLADIDPWARLGIGSEEMSGFLSVSTDTKRCFTILCDGDRAGVIVLRHPWLMGPYLNLFAILPGYQRTGVGRAVMAWFESEAIAAGARNAFLCVSAFNIAAIAFYRRCGYSPAAFLDDLIKDGEDEILMRKRLHRTSSSA